MKRLVVSVGFTLGAALVVLGWGLVPWMTAVGIAILVGGLCVVYGLGLPKT